MSHQAQGSDSGSRENHQDLHLALVWLMKLADFSEVCFRKDCRWTTLGLVMSAILWAWSGATTLGCRFEQAKKIGRRMLGKKQVPDSSYQAFMKLLQTWTAKLLSSLSQAFQARMASVFANRWKIGDFVALAVDGSRFELPRTKSNEEYFATPARKKKSEQQDQEKIGSRQSSPAIGQITREESQQPTDVGDDGLAAMHRTALELATRTIQ